MENNVPPVFIASAPQAPTRKPTSFFTGALIAFVIGSMAAGYYFFYYQPPTAPLSQEAENPTAQEVKAENPVSLFYQKFSTQNYRIKTKSKLEGAGDIITYYQKGKLVRLDINSSSASSTIIFKDGKMYNIDHLEKVFIEEDENNPFLSKFVNLYKIISIVEVLVMSETPSASPWKLLPPDPNMPGLVGYETLNREVNLRSVEGPLYMDMRIFIDPKTNLIMGASLASVEEKNFDENMVTLEYEVVEDMEPLKQFPQSYQKKGLFDSLKFVPQN